MSQRSVRQASRRPALDAQAVLRRERADRPSPGESIGSIYSITGKVRPLACPAPELDPPVSCIALSAQQSDNVRALLTALNAGSSPDDLRRQGWSRHGKHDR